MCRFTTLCRILALDILISELSPACLTGISGCFFSLGFLFACFSFLCSLWLAFQVLPGPCNLHRPGGIPRIALGKGGKKKKKVRLSLNARSSRRDASTNAVLPSSILAVAALRSRESSRLTPIREAKFS